MKDSPKVSDIARVPSAKKSAYFPFMFDIAILRFTAYLASVMHSNVR